MDQDSHHSRLKSYYKSLFPCETLASYFTSSASTPLSHREFSFTRGDIYMRYKSFADAAALKKSLLQILPDKIDIGAVYNQDPSYKSSDLQPMQKEFCVDIDISDYDDIRVCCKGASLCQKCWPLMHSAIEILNFAFAEWFAFENVMWVFSGRRGIHAWINDERVLKYNHQERSAVAEFIHLYASNDNNKTSKIQLTKSNPMFDVGSPLFQIAEKWFLRLANHQNWIHDQKICEFIADEKIKSSLNDLIEENQAASEEVLWEAIKELLSDEKKTKSGRKLIYEIVYTFVYPRLDINVSKQTHHLLKSPFVIHPKTDLVCMVIPDEEVLRFNPESTPSLEKLLDKDEQALSIFRKSVETFDKHAHMKPAAQ